MPVPSTLADLSATAASNSPAGSEAIGTSLDDYLRATQAILKRVTTGADAMSAPNIDGGTIDGATVGATTPAAGTFTTLTSTGNATLGDAEATDTHAIKGATTLLANSASAALTITQTGAGNALVVEDSASPDSTPFVIDANGNMLAGYTARFDISGAGTGQYPAIGAATSSPSDPKFAALSFSNDAAATGLVFVKSRSATVGTNTIVQSGDVIGSLLFRGADGANYINAASISATVDGTPGLTDMPGRIVISTTADGASSPTEGFRIAADKTTTLGGTSTAPALSVIPVASQTRWVTVTGSNGADPIIGTSAGSLALSPSSGYAQLNASGTGGLIIAAGAASTALATFYVGGTETGRVSSNAANVVNLQTASAGTIQVQVQHTASANRYITLTGSNGGNPTIGVSGGTLAISAGALSTSSTNGIGYGTGSGGAVTQITSRTTGVTLDRPNVAITLVSAAGSTAWQSFTVTNSTVAATDVVHVCQKSGTDLYEVHVTAVAAGSFRISFKTTGGTTTEQPVFNFAVIKAVTS